MGNILLGDFAAPRKMPNPILQSGSTPTKAINEPNPTSNPRRPPTHGRQVHRNPRSARALPDRPRGLRQRREVNRHGSLFVARRLQSHSRSQRPLIMAKKITWEWLEPRLEAVNVTWLERESGLRPKRINDVRRGKSTLTLEELLRIQKSLGLFRRGNE